MAKSDKNSDDIKPMSLTDEPVKPVEKPAEKTADAVSAGPKGCGVKWRVELPGSLCQPIIVEPEFDAPEMAIKEFNKYWNIVSVEGDKKHVATRVAAE